MGQPGPTGQPMIESDENGFWSLEETSSSWQASCCLAVGGAITLVLVVFSLVEHVP